MSQIKGPVPLTSKEYVRRKFEAVALASVLKREWLLLLGPRQHGKTSALIRLRDQLIAGGLRCAFVDLQSLPPGLTFEELARWFAWRVASSLGNELKAEPKWRRDSIEEWLACAVPEAAPPVVIIIDEASGIRDTAIRNAFFGQIRAIKSAAAVAEATSLLATVQFVFAGTFRPETLVDDLNSPFNVCTRIDTTDLGAAEVEELAKITLGDELAPDLAACIYDSVGGQPHMVQSLLAIAASAGGVALQVPTVETAIDDWKSNGSDHIDSIFNTVVQDPELLRIAAVAAANGGKIANDPANVDFRYMTVLGLMRRLGEHLVFRNSIYRYVADTSPQLKLDPIEVVHSQAHLYREDIGSYAFIADPQYREICLAAYNGAVVASQMGAHRLALVGFGTALEALLIDRLIREQPAALATAVAAAQSASQAKLTFATNYESATDPSTWRLVNLMKVARRLNRVRGPLELPESLREMRNFVHPKLMKTNYLAEDQLQPESLAAAGLFLMVRRDIQLP